MTRESLARARVVDEARRWLRTPYHSNADVIGAGVDCGMLLVRAFVDSGLMKDFDPRPYPIDWMLHNDGERYLGFVAQSCTEVVAPEPGDIAVFRFGRCYSHGAIVSISNPLTIIHAYQPAGCVMEERVESNADLAAPFRKIKFFSYWARR